MRDPEEGKKGLGLKEVRECNLLSIDQMEGAICFNSRVICVAICRRFPTWTCFFNTAMGSRHQGEGADELNLEASSSELEERKISLEETKVGACELSSTDL